MENVESILSSTAKGKDTGIISKGKQTLQDLFSAMKNKETAFKVFDKNFLFIKSFGFFFLLVLTIVHYSSFKKTGLVTKKPLLFFLESCVFGLSAVVPFLMLTFLRNKGTFNGKTITSYSIALFVVFFGLNYILELSGFYPYVFHEKQDKGRVNIVGVQGTDDASLFKKSLATTSEIVILATFTLSIFSLLFASAFIIDTSPHYTRFKSIRSSIVFTIEMLLFGVISAVPIFFIVSNRDKITKNTTGEFLIVTAKFALLHIVFQVSGFYKSIYAKKH